MSFSSTLLIHFLKLLLTNKWTTKKTFTKYLQKLWNNFENLFNISFVCSVNHKTFMKKTQIANDLRASGKINKQAYWCISSSSKLHIYECKNKNVLEIWFNANKTSSSQSCVSIKIWKINIEMINVMTGIMDWDFGDKFKYLDFWIKMSEIL